MRWKKLKICNLGPFRNEVTLDIEAIPGPIVAITGDNGEGKTVMLELLMAARTRECETRGRIVDLTKARKAYFETELEYRRPYTIRHMIDGIARESEALVKGAVGKPEYKGTKVSKFKTWAAKHLPDAQVLYNGQFAAQSKKGILGLKPGPRKSVILEALGCSEYEELASRAGSNARDTAKDCEGISGRINDERARGGNLEEILDKLSLADALELEAESHLTYITAALEVSKRNLETSKVKAAEYERRRQVGEKLDTAVESRGGLIERLENNRAILGRRAEVDAAVARAAEMAIGVAELEREISANSAAAATKQTEIRGYEKGLETATERREAADTRIAAELQVLKSVEDYRKSAKNLKGLKNDAAKYKKQIRKAEDDYQKEVSIQFNGMENRIGGLRGTLQGIADDHLSPAHDIRDIASHGIMHDDNLAGKIRQSPEAAKALKTEINKLSTSWNEAQKKQAAAERKAALLDSMDQARERLKGAEENRGMSETAIVYHNENITRLKSELKDLDEQKTKLEEKKTTLETEKEAADKTAKYKEYLDQAETRIKELEPQIEVLDKQIAVLETELESIPDHSPDDCTVALNEDDVKKNEEAHKKALERMERNRLALALAKEALDRAEKSQARQKELAEELAAKEELQADWTRLSKDLGKNGLQAFEIDCAGPELTEIANDLLHNCHGPRFTVKVETTKLDSKGQRELEGCEITVIDSQEGLDLPGERLGGGHQVIVDLPLRLALTALANNRAQADCRPTLVFDESAAAVSQKNAPAYVAMLRRAVKMFSIDKALIVTHAPWLEALADSVVRVQDRKIEVMR